MKKIIILTVFLLITAIALAGLYFSNLFRDDRNSNKVLGYIPADAALILQFTNDDSFYEIFDNYQLFNRINGNVRENELRALKSAFLNHPQVAELIDQQKLFLSFHTEQDSVSFLWISMLNNNMEAVDFQEDAAHKFKILPDNTHNTKNQFFSITLPDLDKPFFIFIDKSIVLGSFSKKLLLKTLNKREVKIGESFIEEISNQGIKNDNSLINLYLNLETLQKYLANYFKDSEGGNFTLLKDVKGVSTLNMNFKSDALMFNGITKPDSVSINYLNLFLHQNPVRNTLMRVVPENTSDYMLFGLSNYQQFNIDLKKLLKKRKQLDKLAAQIQTIANENGINPERDIKSLWGKEFITFQLDSREKFAAIKIENGSQLKFLLEPLSSTAAGEIRQLNYTDLFYFYFGDPLQAFRRPYYFITDNVIFIANSLTALQRFNSQYATERFLYKTEQFIHFEQLVANQSNITLFVHNNNSKSTIRTGLRTNFANTFTNSNYGLQDFYGLSFQLSGEDRHFFTNLYIGGKDDLKKLSIIGSTDTIATDYNVR
ncbi:MAG TPA: hypothetical protein VNI52_00270 [Sphingobacteriaceae bacterium]|nr:hypothetical protein [Sphingobacteriaceae bacterium]